MSALELVFWGCLLLGLYPYVIYPACVAILATLVRRRVRRASITPCVTVVISAYNEAGDIEATVRNKLTQDYPSHLLDVMVASDGSSDGTDERLNALCAEDARVTFMRREPRRGKTAALNALAELARGEIIVFADANSIYRADAVRLLVANFADPSVGYVTGRMLYVNPDGSVVGDGCSAYMRYENWLRSRETLLGSIVGVDGGLDAVRSSLYRPMGWDQLPDFVLPLNVVAQGYRVVFEPRAQLCEESLVESSAEFRMRVRVSLRALWALRSEARLLNPLAHPLYAWQLWSHKVLRYLSFVPLTVAAVLNFALLGAGWVYGLVLGAQVVFWLAVLAGSRGADWPLARMAYYFLLVNAACAVALARFLRGEKQVLWQPRVG